MQSQWHCNGKGKEITLDVTTWTYTFIDTTSNRLRKWIHDPVQKLLNERSCSIEFYLLAVCEGEGSGQCKGFGKSGDKALAMARAMANSKATAEAKDKGNGNGNGKAMAKTMDNHDSEGNA